ncbi:protein gucd1 [Plakobranchus ocellatus]|uniref:Protein gucd1 n=1 Tax=Plakobranchus ocellatus TaxID=259542 RepID=A0AAV4B4D5_9GAST|nr:protein gucd1 [Plakobranchus ocellatus]
MESQVERKEKDSFGDGRKGLDVQHLLSVPLVNQCYSWDCGLACVCMVLRTLGKSCTEVYTEDLDAMECGESIWTIDLAYILSRHNVPLEFYTITLGVNSEHFKKPFYQSHFNHDESRVNLLFQKAEQRGIHAQKRRVQMEELLQQVQQQYAVIVLVNQSYLHCLNCKSSTGKVQKLPLDKHLKSEAQIPLTLTPADL